MPEARRTNTDSNWILQNLTRKDSALLAPELESVDLALRRKASSAPMTV